MVAGLCIPNRFAMDIFCVAIHCHCCDRIDNGELSIDKSGVGEPGEIIAN
jgi:hypothetical protein